MPAQDIPGLNPIQESGKDVKLPTGVPVEKEGIKVQSVRTLEGLLQPALITIGALAAPGEGKALEFGLKLITGLKPPPIGGGDTPSLTPGAGLLLLPEPIGVLPQRFFMDKPKIPGTNIFFDPIYTGKKFLDRREQRKREEIIPKQLDALKEVIPQLGDADLAQLLQSSDLKREFLPLLDAVTVNKLLLDEIDKRRAIHAFEEGTRNQLRRQITENEEHELAHFTADALFAANPPDP